MLSRMRNLWRNLVHRDRIERDLAEELDAVFDTLMDEKIAAGMSPADARRATTIQLGRIDSIKAQVREARSGAALESLWRDIRFGVRLLRRTPSFAIAAILSLTLGIGANSAVFGLLNAVRLRSLPVPDAGELAEIWLEGPRCCRHTGRNRQLSLPLFRQIEEHQQAFSSLFAFADTRFNLAPQGEVRYVEGLYVSAQFFPVLRIQAALGRTLNPSDDRPGCANASAVISDSLWRREFAARPDVLTRTLTLRSGSHPIVGVMSADFFGVEVGRRFDVALPMCASGFNRPDHWWLAAFGRLKEGWTTEQASAHIETLAPALLRAATPPNYSAEQAKNFSTLRLHVRPAQNGVSPLRQEYEEPLWLLLAITGLVLLTACANVASLSLVRGTTRAPELALRLSLGASRGQLVRQLLVEGMLLALVGTAAGLLLARIVNSTVVRLLSTPTDPIALDVGPDWRVLTFTTMVIALTTIGFALAPAIRATRSAQLLATGGRTTAARERVGARDLLVAVQVAMSVMLVTAAMLFVLTLRNLSVLDLGFRPGNVLVANVFLADEAYAPDSRAAARRQLTDRLASLPGVEAVAHAATPPLGGSVWDTIVRAPGTNGEITGESNRNEITPGYFSLMGIRFIAGRDFGAGDTVSSPKVAIVNQTFARRFCGDASPLGQRFMEGDQQFEVVGLVGDSKQNTLREPFRAIAYTPASQVATPPLTIRYLVKSRLEPASTLESIRRALSEFDPAAGVRFAALDQLARDAMIRERLMAALSGFFGVIALALAAVGVHGIVSYAAVSRRREIAIRLALGATAPHVLRTLLGRTALVGGAGLAGGLVLAASTSIAATSLLYGVEPRDPSLFALIVAVIVLSAMVAALVPARRALATDPVAALKAE